MVMWCVLFIFFNFSVKEIFRTKFDRKKKKKQKMPTLCSSFSLDHPFAVSCLHLANHGDEQWETSKYL